jgi:hypothetical protein
MYDVDAARTATVDLTPRQWVRLMLDPRPLSLHLTCYVCTQLPLSERYPADTIAASATPREASYIAAILREHEKGY